MPRRAPRRPLRSDRWRDGQQRDCRRAPRRGRGRAGRTGRALACESALARSRASAITRAGSQAAALIRPRRPRADCRAPLVRPASRSRGGEPRVDRSRLQRRPATVSAQVAMRGRPEWVCYYFINDSASRRSSSTCREQYERSARALACHALASSRPHRGDSVSTRLTTPRFPAAD